MHETSVGRDDNFVITPEVQTTQISPQEHASILKSSLCRLKESTKEQEHLAIPPKKS